MRLAEVLRGTKNVTEDGRWQSGHIMRSAFPLSAAKTKNYKFGPEYRWRVIRFDCLLETCRVLIVINEGKQIYRATLGIEEGADMKVLCQYEFHASEPGWHCHLTLEDHTAVPAGIVRSHLRRWPQAKARHSQADFNVSTASAISHAAERFRFRAQGALL